MNSTLELMNTKELAQMLRVTRPTLYSLIRNDGLPAGCKIGRRCRVWTLQEVEAWLESKKGVAGNE